MKIKPVYWKLVWGFFALLALTGCDPLKGLGEGLSNLFKGFHFP